MVIKPRELSPEALIADDEIASNEFARSKNHQLSDNSWSAEGHEDARQEAMALWELVKSGEITSDLFLDNPFARTATLGILRLYGDWEAANDMQQRIIGPDSPFMQEPLNARLLGADSPEAERITRIEWGVVSVGGLTMVVRRRRLLKVDEPVHEGTFETQRGPQYRRLSKFEVDKVSTFALDIEKLDSIDPRAAREIRIIIICGMLATTDTDKVKRAVTGGATLQEILSEDEKGLQDVLSNIFWARAKMREYNINPDAVAHRLTKREQYPERIRRRPTIDAIENEIREPMGLLIPSTVTYYGERKSRDRPVVA